MVVHKTGFCHQMTQKLNVMKCGAHGHAKCLEVLLLQIPSMTFNTLILRSRHGQLVDLELGIHRPHRVILRLVSEKADPTLEKYNIRALLQSLV